MAFQTMIIPKSTLARFKSKKSQQMIVTKQKQKRLKNQKEKRKKKKRKKRKKRETC